MTRSDRIARPYRANLSTGSLTPFRRLLRNKRRRQWRQQCCDHQWATHSNPRNVRLSNTLVATLAVEQGSEKALASRFGDHPRPELPRWNVANVLRVTASEVRDPVSFLVLVVPNDWLLHLPNGFGCRRCSAQCNAATTSSMLPAVCFALSGRSECVRTSLADTDRSSQARRRTRPSPLPVRRATSRPGSIRRWLVG